MAMPHGHFALSNGRVISCGFDRLSASGRGCLETGETRYQFAGGFHVLGVQQVSLETRVLTPRRKVDETSTKNLELVYGPPSGISMSLNRLNGRIPVVADQREGSRDFPNIMILSHALGKTIFGEG